VKLLIVTNLFPNVAEPNRSPFNFQQFKALAKLCELKVVAPVPFFAYDKNVLPTQETISDMEVFHPRYLAIPKILRSTHGPSFFMGIWHTLRNIQETFHYDAILAAWAYPDAYGTALAARLLRKRLFVKVQGSDINLAHHYRGRVPMIRWALNQAEMVIAVSRPLKEKVTSMGIPEGNVVVIPNGVDKVKFYLRDRSECRALLGLAGDKRYVLFIGNLAEVKGCKYLLQALTRLNLSETETIIIGDGPLGRELESLANRLGIRDHIQFKGRQPYEDIPFWLNAADILCLPSLNEGCPNVVLEALACGTRVVASSVGGVPDLIDAPDKGWLARPADTDDLARCIHSALMASDKDFSASLAMSWEENADQLYRILYDEK
jgi:glycosyltransferase involved in cell wall biosynthesis